MKIIFQFSLVITFILLTAFSCGKKKKDPESLPAITQTGKGTFGCLIDGELWWPRHYSNSFMAPRVLSTMYEWNKENERILTINANYRGRNDNYPKEYLNMVINTDAIEEKVYLDVSFLGDSLARSGTIYTAMDYRGGPCSTYRSILGDNSWVLFSRFDTTAHIAAGTFSLNLLNMEDEMDTVKIRDGRFDLYF